MSLTSKLLPLFYRLPPRGRWTALSLLRPPVHYGDDIALWKRHMPFDGNDRFQNAYTEATKIAFATDQLKLLDVRWRTYTCCWAAEQGLVAGGDFVECGVNTGIHAGTICRYLDFAKLDRTFYLFDTFEGIPLDLVRPDEQDRVAGYNRHYGDIIEVAKRNFAPFPNAKLVKGRVPDILPTADIRAVGYLSIDMNVVEPERAALEYFWPKMSPGGVIVLDDYGFTGHEEQREAADIFARNAGVPILAMPTGQGIIIKPHSR